MLPMTGTGASAVLSCWLWKSKVLEETKLLPRLPVVPLPLRDGSKGSHSFRLTSPGGATLTRS